MAGVFQGVFEAEGGRVQGINSGKFCPAKEAPPETYCERCVKYVGLRDFLVLNGFEYFDTFCNVSRFVVASNDVPTEV